MDKLYNAKGNKYYANKWSVHHMTVLYNYMIENGLTPDEFAEKLNMKAPTLRRWFRHDDVSLSSLNEVLKSIGLRVACKYEVKSPKDEVIKMGRPFIVRESKQLLFLQEAILEAGTTAEEIGKKIGLGSCTMRRWVASQNIYLSKIFEIAEAMKWKLSISLVPLEEGEDNQGENEVIDKAEKSTEE